MCSGTLKYFRHNSVFFHFRTTRCVVVVREVADTEVVNREVVGTEVQE